MRAHLRRPSSSRHRPDGGNLVVVEQSDLLVASRRRSVAGVSQRTWVGGEVVMPRVGAWSVLDTSFVLVLAAIVALNIADLVVTLYETLRVGWEAEGNALLRAIGSAAGPWLFALVKLSAVLLTIPLMWRSYRIGVAALSSARSPSEATPAARGRATMIAMTGALALFYVWVVQNNLRVVGL